MRMLSGKYKKRLLAVLFLVMEATSVALDQFGKSKLVVLLAAFILSALGFAITLYTCIKRRARLEAEKQLKVVEVVFSLIQLVASFVHFAITVLNIKNGYDLSIFLPLAFALTAVVFVFKNDGNDDCTPEGLPIISKFDGKKNDSTPGDLLEDNVEIMIDKSKQERSSLRKRSKNLSDILDYQDYQALDYQRFLKASVTDGKQLDIRNLRMVDISSCPGLRDLTELVFAPHLKCLVVSSCSEVENIICVKKLDDFLEKMERATLFENIEFVELHCLQNLKSICRNPMPLQQLKKIKVIQCPKLDKLPLDFNSAKERRIVIEGEQDWWDGLQWENLDTQNAFLPCFSSSW